MMTAPRTEAPLLNRPELVAQHFRPIIAGLAIEKFCRNGFVNRTYTEDYTWEEISKNFRPGQPARIKLRRYPIVSVTSLTDQDSPANTVPSTDYWIDKVHGYLIASVRWTVPQDTNGFPTYWTIIYVAGRFTATSTVDEDLKLACKMQVAAMWRRPDLSVTRKRVDSLELGWATQENAGNLIQPVKELLAPYVSREV